ncbi:unnamed protein product, partial [Symbiodinium sp. CCMP2456]
RRRSRQGPSPRRRNTHPRLARSAPKRAPLKRRRGVRGCPTSEKQRPASPQETTSRWRKPHLRRRNRGLSQSHLCHQFRCRLRPRAKHLQKELCR